MVWGRPKPNASNGGWIDYSNGKGRGSTAGGWGGQRPWQHRGDRGSWGAKGASPQDVSPAFMKAWTAEQTKRLDASLAKSVAMAMQKALGQTGGGQAKQQAKQQAGKDAKWVCPCGYANFGFRLKCKTCELARSGASPSGGGASTPAGGATMEVDTEVETAETLEQELKGTENLIKVIKTSEAPPAHKAVLIAGLQEELHVVKEKIRQARPLPVRLQAAVKLQEAAEAAVQAALEAAEQSRQVYEAKQAAVARAKEVLAAANCEVSEVQAC